MERLRNVHLRVAELVQTNALNGRPWDEVRRKILWAGGLRDLPDARPGLVRSMFVYLCVLCVSTCYSNGMAFLPHVPLSGRLGLHGTLV